MNDCPELTYKNSDTLVHIAADQDTPVLIRGAVNHWPSVKAAQSSISDIQSYLLALASEQPLLTYRLPSSEDGRIFYTPNIDGMNFTREMSTLDDIIHTVNNTTSKEETCSIYMGSTNADRHFPAFRQQNKLDFGVPDHQSVANVWLGNQSRVAAHHDFPYNFACCVAGQRKVTLFPPEQLPNLYIGPLAPTPGGPAISLVNHVAPDFTAHPNYAEALKHAQQAILNPGDVLFIPSMWWHEVQAQSAFNVLVNYWWKKTPAFQPPPTVALDAALLTIRNLTPSQKSAWKALFDYYIFNDTPLDHIPDGSKGVLGELNENQALQLRSKLLNALNR